MPDNFKPNISFLSKLAVDQYKKKKLYKIFLLKIKPINLYPYKTELIKT